MEYYLPLKLVHIVSATILFGTGLGSAFYMWRANKSGDVAHMATTARNVVLADWVFTTPAVFVQLLTGLVMIYLAGIPLMTGWVFWSLILFLVVGLCWLPVVWIQIRISKTLSIAVSKGVELDRRHRCYMRWWYSLGWPAFILVMVIFYMMVVKPS